MSGPGYWMYETSGILRPAIEAFLNHEPMTLGQIAALRAYLRQWIDAPIWDANPHMNDRARAWLADLRARVDGLTTREAIAAWVDEAIDGGIDPL